MAAGIWPSVAENIRVAQRDQLAQGHSSDLSDRRLDGRLFRKLGTRPQQAAINRRRKPPRSGSKKPEGDHCGGNERMIEDARKNYQDQAFDGGTNARRLKRCREAGILFKVSHRGA